MAAFVSRFLKIITPELLQEKSQCISKWVLPLWFLEFNSNCVLVALSPAGFFCLFPFITGSSFYFSVLFPSIPLCTQGHTCFGLKPKADYLPNVWETSCPQMALGSTFFGTTFVRAHGSFLSLRQNMTWESFIVTQEETLHIRMKPSLQGSLKSVLIIIPREAIWRVEFLSLIKHREKWKHRTI